MFRLTKVAIAHLLATRDDLWMEGRSGRKDLDDASFLQRNTFMAGALWLHLLSSTTSLDWTWSLENMVSCSLALSSPSSHLLNGRPVLAPSRVEI